jgi:predicted Zn-ribbon and HTH transcriptional regulator
MAAKKKAPSGTPVKYGKIKPLKCEQCGCPTFTLYAGKCFSCHSEGFEEAKK